MNQQEIKYVIRGLAYEWSKAELPSSRLTYQDYIRTIDALFVVAGSVERATHIFGATLAQARMLGYSSEWLEAELNFETQAETFGDRGKWMKVIVASQEASDAALDLFNERANRFKYIG